MCTRYCVLQSCSRKIWAEPCARTFLTTRATSQQIFASDARTKRNTLTRPQRPPKRTITFKTARSSSANDSFTKAKQKSPEEGLRVLKPWLFFGLLLLWVNFHLIDNKYRVHHDDRVPMALASPISLGGILSWSGATVGRTIHDDHRCHQLVRLMYRVNRLPVEPFRVTN